jgi:ATP-dependent RNA helicase DeaD
MTLDTQETNETTESTISLEVATPTEETTPAVIAAAAAATTGTQFSEFGLCEPLMAAIKDLGFTSATPIQEKAIPKLLAGCDLIACAQTGSGKTAAFGLPMLEILQKDLQKTSLILAPTRELAEQIHNMILDLGRYLPQFRTSLLIGGTSMMPQKRTLSKNPKIIVATPGRLLDHLRQRTARLDQVCYLVLDEADRMLDMGFEPQLAAILKFLPKERQSLLFSATIPTDIIQLSKNYLSNPERVTIDRKKESEPKINEIIVETTSLKKRDALLEAINARQGSMLIFTRTQQRTERICDFLHDYGLSVGQLHGGRTHGQRQAAIRGFRDGSFRVLVATDIAARGLDIDHVEAVINYDLPRSPEDYVHRIGRTGRAGREGEAISLIEPEERNLWRGILRLRAGNQPSSYNQRGAGGGSFAKRSSGFGERGPREGGFGNRGGGPRSDRRFDGPRNDRPSFNNFNNRGDAPRSERPAFASRDEAPRTDRPAFGARSDRPSFGNRDRPAFGARSERPAFGNRSDGPRRSDRPAFGNRSEPRTDAPRGERPSFNSRPNQSRFETARAPEASNERRGPRAFDEQSKKGPSARREYSPPPKSSTRPTSFKY